MEIPIETKKLCSKIANAYKVKARGDKKRIAKMIYKGLLSYNCSYLDAVVDDLWLRYPHELNNSFQCNEAGLYIYLLAKECDLDPRIHAIYGLNGWGGYIGHTIVDVDVGKDKRYLIDPVQKMFGPFNLRKKYCSVTPNLTTTYFKMKFKTCEMFEEKEYLEFFDYLRNEGVITNLTASQSLFNGTLFQLDSRYIHETKTLELSYRNYSFAPQVHEGLITYYSFNDWGDLRSKGMIIHLEGIGGIPTQICFEECMDWDNLTLDTSHIIKYFPERYLDDKEILSWMLLRIAHYNITGLYKHRTDEKSKGINTTKMCLEYMDTLNKGKRISIPEICQQREINEYLGKIDTIKELGENDIKISDFYSFVNEEKSASNDDELFKKWTKMVFPNLKSKDYINQIFKAYSELIFMDFKRDVGNKKIFHVAEERFLNKIKTHFCKVYPDLGFYFGDSSTNYFSKLPKDLFEDYNYDLK